MPSTPTREEYAQLPVEYVTAGDVDEAVDLLAEPATMVVASGYSLLPQLKDGDLGPDRLVDISGIDALRGITADEETVRIGALETHSQIRDSPVVRAHTQALWEAVDSVGDYMAKRQGTIGGNLAFASRKYDPPAAVLALGGEIVVAGPAGQRRVDADEWFLGPETTALEEDELVTEIVLPKTAHSGYIRTSEYSGYAIVSAAATLELADGVVESARVTANGALAHPIRLSSVEQRLRGETLDDELRARAAETALQTLDPDELVADDTASGRHRRQLVRSYCERALERASPQPHTR